MKNKFQNTLKNFLSFLTTTYLIDLQVIKLKKWTEIQTESVRKCQNRF